MPRIAPDLFDQIVWPLTETSGAYRNTGQYLPNDLSTDLNITNSIIRTGTGLFDNCPQVPGTSNFPTGSSSTRNYIAGGQNILLDAPITLSCWVNMRSYTTSNAQTIVGKEYRDSSLISSWTNPYYAMNISLLTTNGGGDWQAAIATSSSTRATFSVTDFPIPIGTWSHVGMTYDGLYLRVYLNGCQMIYYSGGVQYNTVAASALSYTDGTNGYGYWRIGAITATGSTSKEEPNMQIQDVRIANIARPLSYFKNIYAAGALPIPAGRVANAQYYKLRAYDLACSTPTEVTWVDTQISLTNAPAFPCGGPYSEPEVLETWYA